MARGLFIVVEGCDGTGKTTLINRLEQLLRSRGFDIVSTREPGGTPIGEKIRDVLLDRANSEMSMRAEALLYAASRAQIVDEVIAPALACGKAVVCQRYYYSSIAYQGVAGGLGEFVRTVNQWAINGVEPDLVLLLDMDPAKSLTRRPGDADRIEVRATEYHRKVRQAFLDMAFDSRGKFVVIDASLGPEEVYNSVESAVLALIAR